MIDLSGFMPLELTEQLSFILDLGGAIVAALIGGAIAVRLRQPAVVGYLLAGVVIGPFTPGFVGGQERIAILAEVGVVLLLFALGVEFSIRELRSVGRVVIPGGIAQVLIVGACLSLSSTIVVLKQLIDRGEMDSAHGRAAVGWSIVQDIATIVFIVALPPLAGGDLVVPFVIAMVKAVVFLALAYVLGTRLLPWGFATIARMGSSELFLLAVVATALMTAFISSAIFGLSLALGAFVAGVLVSESELSHQAAAEVTPFRDLFAVLFFVSVGMLVDPAALVADAPIVALLVVVAVAVKGVSITMLGRGLGLPLRSAIILGAIMAQVGEFSLILAENGRHLDLLDARTYNIVLGTAVVSIVLSPFIARFGDVLVARYEARALIGDLESVDPTAPALQPVELSRTEQAIAIEDEARRPTVVVLGAGRVGRVVVTAVRTRGFRCVVVDRDARRLETVRRLGASTVFGDAANIEILKRLGLDRARVLIIAVGDPLTARLAAERARRLNPRLSIASRARGRREIETLQALEVGRLADPEAEAAFELARHALQRMGVSGPELNGIVTGLRRDAYGHDRA